MNNWQDNIPEPTNEQYAVFLENIEKGKNYSKLTKKIITDKKGHRKTVWVKTGAEPKAAFKVKASDGQTYSAVKVKGQNKYIAYDSNGKRVMEGLNSSKQDFKDMVEHHIKKQKSENKESKRQAKVKTTGIDKVVNDTVNKITKLKINEVESDKVRQGLIEEQIKDITNHPKAKEYIDKHNIKSMQELVEHIDAKLTGKKKLTAKDIDKQKDKLRKEVQVLIDKKKKLYGNVDVTTPMSADEKQLDRDIAAIWSEINQLIRRKKEL